MKAGTPGTQPTTMAKHRISGLVFVCQDCKAMLHVRPTNNFIGASGWEGDWFMVKNHVWRQGQRKGKARFLCVSCLEDRIDRKLSAADFRRAAKVNFSGRKSPKLRRRMRGLKPAKRLLHTTFTP
jgi:hypothetical protein